MQSLLDFKGLILAQPIADAITLGIGLVLLAAILRKYTAESGAMSDKHIRCKDKIDVPEIQETVVEA